MKRFVLFLMLVPALSMFSCANVQLNNNIPEGCEEALIYKLPTGTDVIIEVAVYKIVNNSEIFRARLR